MVAMPSAELCLSLVYLVAAWLQAAEGSIILLQNKFLLCSSCGNIDVEGILSKDCCDELCYGIFHREDCCKETVLQKLQQNARQLRLQVCDVAYRVDTALEPIPESCSSFVSDSNSSHCSVTEQPSSTIEPTSSAVSITLTTSTSFASTSSGSSSKSSTTTTMSTITTTTTIIIRHKISSTQSHESTRAMSTTVLTSTMPFSGPHYNSWNVHASSHRKKWGMSDFVNGSATNLTTPVSSGRRRSRRRRGWRHTPPQWP